MVDFLGRAQRWLSGVRETYLATENTVVFTYGDTLVTADLTGLGVCVGRYPEVVDTNNNRAYVDVEVRQWLIPTDLLTRMPRNGDKIEETQDGVTYTFEGASFGGRPSGIWHDRERTAYRFNTVQVSVL